MRRGRFLVADPYLEPGYPLALGRRGSAVAHEGELVLVEVAPAGGRARVAERLGSPWDVRALLHGAAGEAGAALPFPPDVEAEALALPRRSAAAGRATAATSATGSRSRSTPAPRRTTTTR